MKIIKNHSGHTTVCCNCVELREAFKNPSHTV